MKKQITLAIILSLCAVLLLVFFSLHESSRKLPPTKALEGISEYIPFLKCEGFEAKKIGEYNIYAQNNPSLSPNQVISVVNGGLALYNGGFADDILTKLLGDEYMIPEFLEDYILYYNNSARQTVELVNSQAHLKAYDSPGMSDLSQGHLLLVNKYHCLSPDYVPENLVKVSEKYSSSAYLKDEAAAAFELMAQNAQSLGYTLRLNSGYRSYSTQSRLYNNYVSSQGKAAADTFSARPGFSEHQTGLAADLSSPGVGYWQFKECPAGKWVHANAHKYGFILRYPENKIEITGYIYESMHFRYVGIEAAEYIYKNNITFDEYHAFFIAR